MTTQDKDKIQKHMIYKFDIVNFLNGLGCLRFIGMLIAGVIFVGLLFLFQYLANL